MVPIIQRWHEITHRILENCEDNQIERLLGTLDCTLEDMRTDDEFGTEGQLDPRGDFRDGRFSVWDMEGFDT